MKLYFLEIITNLINYELNYKTWKGYTQIYKNLKLYKSKINKI